MPNPRLFLAIPYAAEFKWVRDAIATACREHGVQLRSIDEVIRPGGEILAAIHEEIDAADLGAAVVSGLNANVIYELGRLHQASKPTIVVASSDTTVPFDLRTFSRIEYKPDPDRRRDLELVFSNSLAKLLYALSTEGRDAIAAGKFDKGGLFAHGKSREVSLLTIDFEAKRREAEEMLGKSDCETSEIRSFDSDSFKGWHQLISCPDGDDVRIVIDMNGEIKRVKKI